MPNSYCNTYAKLETDKIILLDLNYDQCYPLILLYGSIQIKKNFALKTVIPTFKSNSKAIYNSMNQINLIKHKILKEYYNKFKIHTLISFWQIKYYFLQIMLILILKPN